MGRSPKAGALAPDTFLSLAEKQSFVVTELIIKISKIEVTKMKEGIHPNYQETTIKCACGNEIPTRSTKKDIRVEICSKCHPFYTGKQKLVDSGGRVDRFKKRYNMGK